MSSDRAPEEPRPGRSRGPSRRTLLSPYGALARWRDRRQARADGRAGLPSLAPGSPTGTPALEEYHQEFLARVHRERLRLDADLAPLHESRATLAVRLPATEDALARARASLDAIPVLLDAEQLAVRRGGEARTDADVVAARRAREHEARRRPFVDEAARLHAELTRMRAEDARLHTALHAREHAAATRVRRLHAQAMRRISAYERHLVRRHPAGDRIGPALLARHPVVPDWVTAAEASDPGPRETGPVSPPTGIPTPRSTRPTSASSGQE